MALLWELPNEMLVMVVRFLVTRRINHFDPVATKDLQSLRLVSHRFNTVATPILFKNVVLDFSSFKLADMKRIITFAREKPKLAIHVQRLQLRTPVTTTAFCDPRWHPSSPIVAHLRHLYETELSSALELRVRNSARIHELVIAPLEAQWEDEIPNFDAIRKIMRETMAVLPTLYHVENSVSTHEPERTAMAYQKIWDEMGIDLSGNFPTVTNDQSDTLGRGVSYLMTSLTISSTSLKLREVPFENWLYHWRIPDQVVHLDIELRISQEVGTLEDPVQTCFAVQDWRKQFTALKRLKTLRLSLSCEGLYPNEDEWFEMGGPHLYFDNLLTSPELSVDRLEAAICELEHRKHKGISEAGVINDCTFPRLESLSLINCPLREEGLLYLAAMHQRTLRSIQLHRVVFDATSGQMPVRELAKIRNYLPHLTHLVLSKIDLYDPDRGHFDLDLEMREEVGSVYRWDKGDGGGDDGLVRYAWDLGRIVERELGPGS